MSYSCALQTPPMALAAAGGIRPSAACARASAASKASMPCTTAPSSKAAIMSGVVRKLSKIDTLTGASWRSSYIIEERGFLLALHADVPAVLGVAGLAREEGGAALRRHLVQDGGLRQAGVVLEEEGGELVLDQAAREHGDVGQRLAARPAAGAGSAC
jgi:hypothetical protein